MLRFKMKFLFNQAKSNFEKLKIFFSKQMLFNTHTCALTCLDISVSVCIASDNVAEITIIRSNSIYLNDPDTLNTNGERKLIKGMKKFNPFQNVP